MPETRQPTTAVTNVRRLLGGERIAWHSHPVDQVVYPVSGVLSVLTGTAAWVLPSPGRAALIPAGVRHAHRAHGRTTLQTLQLDRRISALPPGPPVVLTVSPLLRELLAVLVGDVGQAVAPRRGGRASDVPDDGGAQPPTDPAERERLLAVLADQLRVPPARSLVLPQPTEPRLVAAARALSADPSAATLSGAATAARTSERTLTRLVRDQLGLSFPQWRTQLRLAQSLLLLADGQTVSATAHRCGWRNASGFTAAFRAAFGTTPGRYQRSLHT
jgi:AraC-like DNA-binding protein